MPGGTETYTLELYEAMRAAGSYEPILLARSPMPRAVHPGTRLTTLGADPGQYLLTTDPEEFDFFYLSCRTKELVVETYRDFLRAMQPGVVHFQHTHFMGVELIREARNTLPDAPIVYTLHEFLPICHHHGQLVRARDGTRCLEASPRRCSECFPSIPPPEFLLRRSFIQSHFACVDRFIAPSQFLRQRFVDWGLPADKIQLEEYGRSLALAPAVEADRGSRTRFGYFGQINPFKGVTVVLTAMRLLAKAQSNGGTNAPTLWVHGANLEIQNESFQVEFRRLLAEAEPAVHFAGPYRRDELALLMANVDWVIVPSIWWENSPLVIQEAFAAGRPVICSDIGGMAENVANGVDGLHFRAGDAFSLADSIERAASTPGLWDRLRRGIRAPYEIGRHVNVLNRLYQDLETKRRAQVAFLAG